jgi:hypothetical protein
MEPWCSCCYSLTVFAIWFDEVGFFTEIPFLFFHGETRGGVLGEDLIVFAANNNSKIRKSNELVHVHILQSRRKDNQSWKNTS